MTRRRLVWLVIILVSMALYLPINRLAHGGTQLQLSIDRGIPLFPPAVIPYLFGTALFICFPVGAAFRAKPGEFEAYAASLLLAILISYAAYLVFPTFVTRPEITATDLFSKVIALLYSTDKAYNAAPSGHAIYTSLSFLYIWSWKPRFRLVWLIVAAFILASTLLTRQHNVLDIASGLIVAVFTYSAGRFTKKKWGLIFSS